jgi:hypothetical protein
MKVVSPRFRRTKGPCSIIPWCLCGWRTCTNLKADLLEVSLSRRRPQTPARVFILSPCPAEGSRLCSLDAGQPPPFPSAATREEFLPRRRAGTRRVARRQPPSHFVCCPSSRSGSAVSVLRHSVARAFPRSPMLSPDPARPTHALNVQGEAFVGDERLGRGLGNTSLLVGAIKFGVLAWRATIFFGGWMVSYPSHASLSFPYSCIVFIILVISYLNSICFICIYRRDQIIS